MSVLGALARGVGLTWSPAADEPVPVLAGGVAGGSRPPPHDPERPLALRSWNLQFAGGRRHFFYDGGPDVRVPAAEVRRTLATIVRQAHAPVCEDGAPALLLLQELDRGSDRTGRIDELEPFLARTRAAASTPYHRSRFIPVPPRTPLGRVELHLATLATIPLARARRLALPLLAEPRWRQAFNLKRALLEVEVPLADGRVLMVGNTHLSAFSHGDGTLPRQVDVLARWMAAQTARGRPFVLAGDLNLLPPGDDPHRLPDPENYADDGDLVGRLLVHARSAVPADAWLAPAWRTYQPYASAPDRVLDYLFTSPDVGVRAVRVDPTDASDHLPLSAVLDLRG